MSVPTITQSPNYNYSPQPRKSRTWLWIVLGSAIGVLLFTALVGAVLSSRCTRFFNKLISLSLSLQATVWPL